MARKLIGRCDDCGAVFDMGADDDLPDIEIQKLRCQAIYAWVGDHEERVFSIAHPSLQPVIMTEAGISPVRPCLGRLRVRYVRRGIEDHYWFELNEALGITYHRHWCPNCGYSDKRWKPTAMLCRGGDYDLHPARCVRIVPIFKSDRS